MMSMSDSKADVGALRMALAGPQLSPVDRVAILSELAHQCARSGLARDGLDAVKEAIELAHTHRLPLAKAGALNAAAVCYFVRDDFLMAIACGIDAYAGFAVENQHTAMGHALTTVAAACKEVGAFDLAEQALRGCINIANRANDKFLLARTQNTLAALLGDLRRFDEAAVQLADARFNLDDACQQHHVAKIDANQCDLDKKRADDSIRRGDPETGQQHYRQALAQAQLGLVATGAEVDQCHLLGNTRMLGELYFVLHDYDQARATFERALVLARQLKQPATIAESLLFLGRIALVENKPADALRLFCEGLECAKRADLKVAQPKIHKELARALLIMGRDSESDFHFDAALQWSRQIAESNAEVGREARLMWNTHFSHHPLIGEI